MNPLKYDFNFTNLHNLFPTFTDKLETTNNINKIIHPNPSKFKFPPINYSINL